MRARIVLSFDRMLRKIKTDEDDRFGKTPERSKAECPDL